MTDYCETSGVRVRFSFSFGIEVFYSALGVIEVCYSALGAIELETVLIRELQDIVI